MARKRSRKQTPVAQRHPSDPTPVSRTQRRRAAMLALGLVVALAAGLFLSKNLLPRPAVTSQTGVPLGRLPRGVGADGLSLLLVTLDTTRADRIGSYGFAGGTTPHLDRLAGEGVMFEQAESVAPLTLPAHSSIFTGDYPASHGVRDNGGFYLDETSDVLAERLQAAGFRTGGFVGSFVLDSKWGTAQGFDHYFDDFDLRGTASMSLGEIERPAGEVADAALAWLDEAPDARFFSWVHFYDPHSPYAPPEPYASRYRDRPYVGEIAYVDEQIGRLLAWLERNDRARDTIVMVIGDHGESLGEHGESGHGFFIYESATRVPFIVRTPFDSMQGRRVPSVVRSVDVMPTALDLLGVAPIAGIAGVSLAPVMSGVERSQRLSAYSEAVYPRYHYGWSDLRALRVGNLKYIAAPNPELYDLTEDPGELTNLYAERSEVADRMHTALEQLEAGWAGEAPAQRADEIDPDTRARLAALGYVGSLVATDVDPAERSSLADPKDKIHLYNLMSTARESSLSEDGTDAAIVALEQVLAEDPTVIDAWVKLGNAHLRELRVPEAIDSYREALELKPEYDLAVINLANAYRAGGRDEEALLGYRQFLRLDPRNAQVRYELAQLLVERGELEEAAAHLEEAVLLSPQMAAAKNALGVIAIRRSDLDRASRLIREALQIMADVRLAHFNLALLAEAKGDTEDAVRLYREELELYPHSYKAEFNLSLLLASLGDTAGQTASLKRSIEINPRFVEGHFFLAKALLDANRDLQGAEKLARTGLSLDPGLEIAPMGHYLLADIFMRQGRRQEAERELASARALELQS